MTTSRERFLESLEKCVTFQNQNIILPPPPRASEEWGQWGLRESIPEEVIGNGEFVDCDVDIPGDWA